MVVYMKGTRRLEEMITAVRQLSYQENYSYTEGWDDNVVSDIFNLALDRLYASLTAIDSPPNVHEVKLDIVARQAEYDIPQDVHMALRIVDVRFMYGSQPHMFITLRQSMIQDRFFHYANIPDNYCIRNGQILLSPAPIMSRPEALIINYQKRMRRLDIRRGKMLSIQSKHGTVIAAGKTNPCQIQTSAAHNLVTGDKVSFQDVGGMTELNDETYTITWTGADTFTLDGIDATAFTTYTTGGTWFYAPISFQLNFLVDSQKDVNLQSNAASILDKVDWCCFVDRNGEPVVNAIPLKKYDQSTFILTAVSGYVPPSTELADLNSKLLNDDTIFVVAGDYSSSHSELDRQCEDHLIEYAVLRLLRLQSAAEPTVAQMEVEDAVLKRLAEAFRRYRPSVMPIVWQQRSSMRRWF